MAARKTTRSRKPARAKATKKTSVRASRKAPGVALKFPSPMPRPVAVPAS